MRLNIKQIMVPIEDFPIISEDEFIHRAAQEIVRVYKKKDSTWRGYESLHVVDRNNCSVGVVTLRSLLRAVHNTRPLNQKSSYIAFIGIKNPPSRVKDIMRRLDNGTIDINDDIDSVVKIIASKNSSFIPVLDGDTLVGMVRAIDLFWFIEDIL